LIDGDNCDNCDIIIIFMYLYKTPNMEHVNMLIKENKLMECIIYLRATTKCYSLIEILCEKVILTAENTENIPNFFWDEYAIALFYLNNKQKSYDCYKNIFTKSKTKLNEKEINHYINNMTHSIQKVQNNVPEMHSLNELLCGGIEIQKMKKIQKINHKSLDEKYQSFNPSIIKTPSDSYIMNIRTANYKFDDNFKYLGDGKYDTINHLLFYDNYNDLLNDIKTSKQLEYKNMLNTGNFDGWEDIRLFYYKNKLHCSFTTLQATPNRLQHICLSDLSCLHEEPPSHILLDGYGNNRVQKNWVPLVSDDQTELYFIYSFYPLTILKYDETMRNVNIHTVSLCEYNEWRGSSPALSLNELGYQGYYLCVIHESKFPTYTHKFVLLKKSDDEFEIISYSPSFYFINSIVEFCAGLTISPDKNEFCISFGKMDREVHIAYVNIKTILNGLFNTNICSFQKNYMTNYNKINGNKINDKISYVTCFFNLSKIENNTRDKSISMYYEKSKFLLNLHINLILYTDDDDLIEYIGKKNSNANIKIIKMELSSSPYYKHIDYVKNVRDKNMYNGFNKNKDTPLYTILSWTKMFLLNQSISLNYFNANYFSWIDFGISHIATTNNVNSFYKTSEKILVECIKIPTCEILDDNFFTKWICHIGEGFFGGNMENMMKMIDKFDEQIKIISANEHVAPLEGGILSRLTYLYPELFEFYYGDYADMIDNRNYMVSSKNILLMMYNFNRAFDNNMINNAYHLCEYILCSANNGHKIPNEYYNKLNSFWIKYFFVHQNM